MGVHDMRSVVRSAPHLAFYPFIQLTQVDGSATPHIGIKSELGAASAKAQWAAGCKTRQWEIDEFVQPVEVGGFK